MSNRRLWISKYQKESEENEQKQVEFVKLHVGRMTLSPDDNSIKEFLAIVLSYYLARNYMRLFSFFSISQVRVSR